jgi:Putative Actinobacterial Holin-X, holin superfamily III
VPVNGRDRSDGRPGPDPAHGGPLPQATLMELIGRLINDVSDLADRQIDLAKQEIGEAKDVALSSVKRIGIGAGIAVGAAVLLIIWAWSAFIWFFNWLGALVPYPTPLGPVQLIGGVIGALLTAITLGWLGSSLGGRWFMLLGAVAGLILGGLIGLVAGLGWLLGMVVPGFFGLLAYRLIRRGVGDIMSMWPGHLLPRTRETLKEDLEWVQHLRTPNAR